MGAHSGGNEETICQRAVTKQHDAPGSRQHGLQHSSSSLKSSTHYDTQETSVSVVRWTHLSEVDYEELTETMVHRSLFIFSKKNPIRMAAVYAITNKYFDWFILAMILANCATLAMYSHRPGFEDTQLAHALDVAEYYFLAVFSMEMVLKIITLGLVLGPGTYLHDGWNILDATVVGLGYLDIAMSGSSYTALRAVRVLRPLRTITHIKGLRVPVVTLLHALPMLRDVGVLIAFALFIFGIVAVQMFAGVLQNRCAAADFSNAYISNSTGSSGAVYMGVDYLLPLSDPNQQCSGYYSTDVAWMQLNGSNSSNSNGTISSPVWFGGTAGGGYACPTQPNPTDAAPFGMFCAPFGNPNNGMTSFDNILWAWLTILQCITQEGWTDVLYWMQDAVSPWVLVYFLVLIVFGSFFLVNLALAVLYLQFTKEFSMAPSASAAVTRSVSLAAGQGSQQEPHMQQQQQQQPSKQPAFSGDGGADLPGLPGSLGPASVSNWPALGHDAGMTADDYDDDMSELAASPRQSPVSTASSGHTPRKVTISTHSSGSGGSGGGLLAVEEHEDNMVASGDAFVTAQIILSSRGAAVAAMQSPRSGKQLEQAEGKLPKPALHVSSRASSHPGMLQNHQNHHQQQQSAAPVQHWLSRSSQHCKAAWEGVRHFCREIIQSGWFSLFNLLVILANTGVMAANYYPMDPHWADASETINIAFSLYFMVELIVKVTGLGPRRYIRDRMNQFDAVVVLASVVEIITILVPGGDASTSSLSVLRTTRLLRAFKLARSWKELNRIITAILHSFSQVLYLSLLLLLFVFIFALMGMQLFGYKFSGCDVPGAQQLCPPGLVPNTDCPSYPDCYVACGESQVFSWFSMPGSPYNSMGFCEQFPRNSSYWGNATDAVAAAAAAPAGTFQYWAQVGKASIPDSRFDNFGLALLTVFQLVTTENWNNVMYSAMAATAPAASLWFIAAIVIGNYILLNLFLAVLLENFGSPSGSDGSISIGGVSTSSSSTLAAAAKAALMLSWMKEMLENSWVAHLVRGDNRVQAVEGGSTSDDWGGRMLDQHHHPGVSGVAGPAKTPHYQVSRLAVAGAGAGDSLHVTGSSAAACTGDAVTVGAAADGSWVSPRDSPRGKSFVLNVSPRDLQHLHRHSALLAPPKPTSSLLASLMGSRHASFSVTPSPGSISRLKHDHADPTAAAGTAGCGVESSRGSCSAALLQGNVDLLLARPGAGVAAAAGSGGSMTGQRSRMLGGSNLQQLQQQQHLGSSGVSRGSMFGAGASSGAGLGGCSSAGGSMADFGSRNWESNAAGDDAVHGSSSAPAAPQLSLVGTSCCLLGPDNWLRMKLARLTSHRHFDSAILVLIFLSSISIALEMPSLDRQGMFAYVLELMDEVFVLLFALEAAAKVLVRGFVLNGPGSYLRSPWNVLDGIIVVIGVIMMAITLSGGDIRSLGSLRALRTLRALRPLRVASRLEGMKVVVDSLFASLPPLGNVVLVCLLFMLLFGIMGTHLLAGMLYSCQAPDGSMYDADYVLPPGSLITREWCENTSLSVTTSNYHAGINVTMPAYVPSREWVNQMENFDNIFQAILTLFQMSTTELWVNTMYNSIAAVGIDQQPQDGNSPALALYFVVFIVFGGFFMLQLFVSVTIEKFAEIQQQRGRSALLTAQQEEWLTIQRMMAEVKPQEQHLPPANSPWRAAVFRLVVCDACEWLVMALITANMIILAMTHVDMNDAWQNFMSYANLVFTVLFAMEAILKCIALGVKPYLRDAWCRFDLLVVAVSIVGVAIALGTPHNLEILPLLRVLRVARVFRLIPKAQGIRKLLQTLVFSLPALGNIGSVLLLFFFIYAVIGMNLFGAVKHGQYLNKHANFNNVGIGLLTLFRMITGESWDGIMQDCMVTTECIEVLEDVWLPDASGALATISVGSWLNAGDSRLPYIPDGAVINRCSPAPLGAVAFFCSFVLLCGFVLVNFVIGVIIDNMHSSSNSEDMPISRWHVDQFARVWSELDPHATQYIPAVELSTLICELHPPMGVKGEEAEREKIQSIIMAIDIPIRKNKVHFLETLHALAGRVAGAEVPEGEETRVHQKLYPRLPVTDPQDAPKYTVAHFYAALYVQAAVRGFLRRHALKGAGMMSGVHDLPGGLGVSEGTSMSDEEREEGMNEIVCQNFPNMGCHTKQVL